MEDVCLSPRLRLRNREEIFISASPHQRHCVEKGNFVIKSTETIFAFLASNDENPKWFTRFPLATSPSPRTIKSKRKKNVISQSVTWKIIYRFRYALKWNMHYKTRRKESLWDTRWFVIKSQKRLLFHMPSIYKRHIGQITPAIDWLCLFSLFFSSHPPLHVFRLRLSGEKLSHVLGHGLF